MEHFNLPLINFILPKVLHYLIHSDQQLRSEGYFANDFMFHPNVVSLVIAKECTICTYAYPILNANYFELATMLRTKILFAQ